MAADKFVTSLAGIGNHWDGSKCNQKRKIRTLLDYAGKEKHTTFDLIECSLSADSRRILAKSAVYWI